MKPEPAVPRLGRTIVAVLAFLGAAILVSVARWSWAGRTLPHGPFAVPTATGMTMRDTVIAGDPVRLALTPAERLVPDSGDPISPADLLFHRGLATGRTGQGHRAVVDRLGRILVVDGALRTFPRTPPRPGVGSRDVVVTPVGMLMRDEATGVLTELDGSALPPLAAVSTGDGSSTVGLAQGNDGALRLVAHAGGGATPGSNMWTERHAWRAAAPALVSAAAASIALVHTDGTVRHLAANGDTLWTVVHRPPGSGVPMAVAHAPDGTVHVLSRSDIGEWSLAVFHGPSGDLLRVAELGGHTPTLAADTTGRVYTMGETRLLSGIGIVRRAPFSPFELDRLGGGTATGEDFTGRVTLVNFWASWCGPCHAELPELVRLNAEIHHDDFALLTMNEDVNPLHASIFIRDYGLDVPVLLGRGRMKARYKYLGLPYTVLLDRQGRIVYRWTGYGGRPQIEAIHAMALAELAATRAEP